MKTTANSITPDDFTRIDNDTNGNPRYVLHFLQLITDRDEAEVKENFKLTLSQNSLKLTGLLYDFAVYKAKQIGGRKYTAKNYGGGIVFQSYNLATLAKECNNINTIVNIN